MRLFVALGIPEGVREKLAAIRSKFPKPESQMRWVRADNFHVTLKFIGEVPGENIPHIIERLRTVQRDLPVQLYFRGLGWFWDAKGFGAFFGKIENGDSFAALAGQVDMARKNRHFQFSRRTLRTPWASQNQPSPRKYNCTEITLHGTQPLDDVRNIFPGHFANEFERHVKII